MNRALLPLLLALPLGCRGTFDVGKYLEEGGTAEESGNETEHGTSSASETRSEETTTDTQDAEATTDPDTETDASDTHTDTDTSSECEGVEIGLGCIELRQSISLEDDLAPRDLEIGRFNGDDLLDLAIPGSPAHYLVGIGGGFGEPFEITGAIGTALAAVDWDEDNKLDLFLIDDFHFELWLSNGEGNFTSGGPFMPGGYDLVVGDFDGDVDNDVAVTGTALRIWRRNANMLAAPIELQHNSQRIVSANLDGDEFTDLLFTETAADRFAVIQSDVNFTFMTITQVLFPTPAAVAVANIDSEPGPEVIAVGGGDAGQLFLGKLKNEQNVESLNMYAVGGLPRAVAVGDIDADGRFDVAVANNTTHDVSVLMNVRGTLTDEVRIPADDPND